MAGHDDFLRRPLPSAQEDLDLIHAIRAGDESARQRLVEAYLGFVVRIAKTYRWQAVRKRVRLGRLVEEGASGLMQAIERFDPGKGYRFSTYATHWIRQAIGRTLDKA